jgi:hypothetical protein
MTARNLNLYLLATRMTSAGAARRDAILAVIGMEVNRKVVKSAGLGKVLQLLRTNVRDGPRTQREQAPHTFRPRGKQRSFDSVANSLREPDTALRMTDWFWGDRLLVWGAVGLQNGVRATELQSCGSRRKQIPPRFAPRNDKFPGTDNDPRRSHGHLVGRQKEFLRLFRGRRNLRGLRRERLTVPSW